MKNSRIIKTEELAQTGVPYTVAIKQLTALSLSRIDEAVLEKVVTKVQKTLERKEQAEKAYEEAREAGVDIEGLTVLMLEWRTELNEYNAACACFTTTVLGQVFTWLEGAGNE